MMTTMRFCANGDEDDVLLSPRCDDDHLTKMRFSAWKPPHNTLFLNPLISTHIEEIFTPPNKNIFVFQEVHEGWLVDHQCKLGTAHVPINEVGDPHYTRRPFQ